MLGNIYKFLKYLTEQKWHQVVYSNLVIVSSIILILSLFGVSLISAEYRYILSSIIQIYIGIFLILRFNPLIKTSNSSKDQRLFDRKVAFSAGIYILSSSLILGILDLIRRKIITWPF